MAPTAVTDIRSTPDLRAMLHGTVRRFRRNAGLIVGAVMIVALMLVAFFAPLPHDPLTPDPTVVLQPPGGSHWFGTDASGFDIFSRTIEAAKKDIPLVLAGTLVSVLVGVPLGLIAGVERRWGERLMRGLEVFQALPLILLAIVIVKVTGNRIENIVFALAIVQVPRFMRLVRGEALSLRESRFVEAARAIGCRRRRVMFRHILPNVSGIILVQCSLAVANGIIVVAALTFIGVGANPPEPTWGGMVYDGTRYIAQGSWWVSVFPGIAIFLVVFAFNLVADGLERIFDADVTRV